MKASTVTDTHFHTLMNRWWIMLPLHCSHLQCQEVSLSKLMQFSKTSTCLWMKLAGTQNSWSGLLPGMHMPYCSLKMHSWPFTSLPSLVCDQMLFAVSNVCIIYIVPSLHPTLDSDWGRCLKRLAIKINRRETEEGEVNEGGAKQESICGCFKYTYLSFIA